MITSGRRTSSNRRRIVSVVATGSLAILTACASGSGSGTTAGGAASAGSTAGVTAAQALVTQRLAVPAAFEHTAPAIPDAAKAKGSTVLFVPISLQVPYFRDVLASMTAAAAHAGVTVKGCDGMFSPAGVAACLNQAVTQKVSAVVLDNVPEQIATQGTAALRAAKIPVVSAEGLPQKGDALFSYLSLQGPQMIAAAADWIAVDSHGKASVLIIEQNDTPLPVRYVDEYLLPEYKKVCPGCTTKVITVQPSQPQNIASQISTALLQNPSITYIDSEFDSIDKYVIAGLQNSPAASKITFIGTIGDLSALQRVKSGQQAATALVNSDFVGWAITDQTLRMITGAAPLEEAAAPWRLFDKTNIGTLDLSQQNLASGSYFGGDTYSARYLELWSLS